MAHKIHVWRADGQQWVCAEYDHGPLCRRCLPVLCNPTLEALIAEREKAQAVVEAAIAWVNAKDIETLSEASVNLTVAVTELKEEKP